MNDDGTMNVKKAIDIINSHNHSSRKFNESAWKNCRRPERASQMLPEEMIIDLLNEFNYVPVPEIVDNNSSTGFDKQ